MNPTASTSTPAAPRPGSMGVSGLPGTHAPQAQALAQAALQWQQTWRDGLIWAADTLGELYSPPFRDGLRGWGLQLESMARSLEHQAMTGLTEGIPERLAQFDRIWTANQQILAYTTQTARPSTADAAKAAQASMAMFLINRNTFFKNYDLGRFDGVGQLDPQQRAAFNDRMDRLETCTEPQVGGDLLRWLARYSAQVSPTPLRRF